MGHRNILTLVDYFETMNNRTCPSPPCMDRADLTQSISLPTSHLEASYSTAFAGRVTTTSPTLVISFEPHCLPSHTYTITASYIGT